MYPYTAIKMINNVNVSRGKGRAMSRTTNKGRLLDLNLDQRATVDQADFRKYKLNLNSNSNSNSINNEENS